MAVQKLDKAEWHPFFDHMAKVLAGKRVEIEVASLALGAQVEAEWLPLLGITYDPKSDVVEIALEGVDHLVHKPREVFVDLAAGHLISIEIVDGDGNRQITKLHDPVLLPPPSGARRSA